MFERFDERARRIVVLAQEEARRLNHDHIGTEHILLGMIREGGGLGIRTLESLQISPHAVRNQVEQLIGTGERPHTRRWADGGGNLAFTPGAKQVLVLSTQEAAQLGHEYVGSGHILLALVREGSGDAAKALLQLGTDLDGVRRQLIQLSDGNDG